MKYSYVFFDMDGTVLDTIGDLTDSVNHILEECGFAPIDETAAAGFLGNGAKHLLECAFELSSGKTADEDLINRILPEYREYYNSHSRINTAPYPGILSLMERLKAEGVRVAVVSNKPDRTVQELSARFFGGLAEFSIGESPAVRRKPAPDMVYEVMHRMGLKSGEADDGSLFGGFPEELRRRCVYVGDTEVDLETADNAGMDCITVTWGFRSAEQLKERGAGVLVSSAEELGRAILES